MHRIALLIALLTVVSACSKPAPPPSPVADSRSGGQVSQLDELMEKSGTNTQVSQIPANVLASADQQIGADVPNAGAIRTALIQAFNPGDLRADTRTHLEGALSGDEIAQVLAWLNSDLGQRITALEKTNSAPEAQKAIAEQYPQLAENQNRVAMVQALDKAIQGTESTVAIVLTVQRSLMSAIVAGLPEERRMSQEQLDALLAQGRETMESQYRFLVEAAYLHNYQELTDAELQTYIDFANSPVARRYHQALAESLQAALAKASTKAGSAIAAVAG